MARDILNNSQELLIPSVKINYITIFGDNAFECLQLILYGWLRNLKMLIILHGVPLRVMNIVKHISFIRKYINKSIKEYKSALGNYKALWYEVNEETIDLTVKFYDKHLRDKNKLISYYNKILRTDKFEAFIKKKISIQIFTLLKDLHIVRISNLKQNTILINKNPINEFVINHMKDKYKVNYHIKWILSNWSLLYIWIYYGWLFKEFIFRGVTFNKVRKKYEISKEATWNFYHRTLRDDILLDNDKFKINDILILEFDQKHHLRTKAFEEAKKRGFDTASIPKLKININKKFFSIIFFYFLMPLKVYLKLLLNQESYFFHYIYILHRECFPVDILMNLYDIKYNLSIIDCDDVAKTITLNKYDSKNIILQWSDLTFYRAYDHAFIAHNTYFVWGNIHYDYHADNYFVNNRVNIGCIYRREFNKALNNKESIIAQIDGSKKGKKTVTFCDASFNNFMENTEYFFLEYLEIIKEFCERNKNINIFLKAKRKEKAILEVLEDEIDQYKKIKEELFSFDNFNYLDPLKWSIEEAIAISDVCVSMGMSSPSTIALICGQNALFFDDTGNIYHPFAKKYKNLIVFEDKELLYKQIDNILNGRFNCKDAISEKEMREYNAFPDDKALKRVRYSLCE